MVFETGCRIGCQYALNRLTFSIVQFANLLNLTDLHLHGATNGTRRNAWFNWRFAVSADQYC